MRKERTVQQLSITALLTVLLFLVLAACGDNPVTSGPTTISAQQLATVAAPGSLAGNLANAELTAGANVTNGTLTLEAGKTQVTKANQPTPTNVPTSTPVPQNGTPTQIPIATAASTTPTKTPSTGSVVINGKVTLNIAITGFPSEIIFDVVPYTTGMEVYLPGESEKYGTLTLQSTYAEITHKSLIKTSTAKLDKLIQIADDVQFAREGDFNLTSGSPLGIVVIEKNKFIGVPTNDLRLLAEYFYLKADKIEQVKRSGLRLVTPKKP